MVKLFCSQARELVSMICTELGCQLKSVSSMLLNSSTGCGEFSKSVVSQKESDCFLRHRCVLARNECEATPPN